MSALGFLALFALVIALLAPLMAWLGRPLVAVTSLPLAAVVPAGLSASLLCQPGFWQHWIEAGQCGATDTPAAVFRTFWLAGLAALAPTTLLLIALRRSRARKAEA